MNIRHDTDRSRIRDILAKSSELEVLNLSEVSSLIALSDRGIWEEVFEAANRVKEKVYGRRIVLFAPLYLSNECANDCMYCGFRRSNRDAVRKSLTVPEAVGEAALLSKRGYRRLLLVASEQSGQRGIDYLTEVVGRIYEDTDMRILHLNSAPVGVEDFRRLKESGVGVYQCFQETYHIPTYRSMHRRGPKSDYSWRLDAMDRAIAGGFEDIGLGVLLGLYDWKWDIAALVAHSLRLLKKYGIGPHTLSVPRLQPAQGFDTGSTGYRVSDDDFKKIVAIFRLALPYVGIVISTREQAVLRDQLFFIGASQISAGSKTSPWGYVDGYDTEQFEIGDTRSLDEVIDKIMSLGLIPSLCTACYREGRSGERFRQLTEEGVIKKYCRENALLSLKEYVEDYVTGERKDFLLQRLEEEVSKSTNGLFGRFREIEEGTRDLHL
jgi:2-iminoacetate synthase